MPSKAHELLAGYFRVAQIQLDSVWAGQFTYDFTGAMSKAPE